MVEYEVIEAEGRNSRSMYSERGVGKDKRQSWMRFGQVLYALGCYTEEFSACWR